MKNAVPWFLSISMAVAFITVTALQDTPLQAIIAGTAAGAAATAVEFGLPRLWRRFLHVADD